MEKEKSIKLFNDKAREIYNQNKPIAANGQKISVINVSKYNQLRRRIKEQVFKLDFPEIEDTEKWNVVDSLLNELDDLIKNNHK